MSDLSGQTRQLHDWLQRMRQADPAAREELLRQYGTRLQCLTRRMFQGFPALRRWEQTDDVYQNAMLRLLRALQEVQPESVRHFLSLAATQIRRELLDLTRHHFGPQGAAAHHASHADKPADRSAAPSPHDPPEVSHDPGRLAVWCEFHQQIASLPDEEREVFDLLWYQDLTQAEAADLLGVSERTVKRRWQSARLRLYEALHGQLPE